MDLDERSNIVELLITWKHIEMWEYCMRNATRHDEITNYKLFEIGIFDNYE